MIGTLPIMSKKNVSIGLKMVLMRKILMKSFKG